MGAWSHRVNNAAKFQRALAGAGIDQFCQRLTNAPQPPEFDIHILALGERTAADVTAISVRLGLEREQVFNLAE